MVRKQLTETNGILKLSTTVCWNWKVDLQIQTKSSQLKGIEGFRV
jgi:hypothetical protein